MLMLHIRKLLFPFKNRMEPTANLASCCETGPRCGGDQLSVRRIVLAELVDHLLVDLIGSKSREQREPSSGLVGLTESGDRIFDPAMDLLSSLRMGVNLGIIPNVEIRTVNELFIFTQPAHLQRRSSAID